MPKTKEIVDALSEDNALQGHTLITDLLAEKTLNLLKEAKKQLVARKHGKRTIVLREDLMAFLKSLPQAEYSRRVA